jgi:hypothetical protein
MSTISEITIEHQELDERFVDSWIDDIEEKSKIIVFSKIRTITIRNSQLFDTLSYDIFHDFVSITQLNILDSTFDSKSLNNLLTYINFYSLSKLDLSGSKFSFFNVNDFKRIRGLFSLMELILPSDMDEHSQKELKKVLNVG